MAYLLIPNASDKLKNSQPQIKANFTDLQTYLTVNHTAIDGTADQGKHKVISMPAQAATPGSPPLDGTDIGLFAKVWATTAANELFLRTDGPTYTPLTGNYLLFSALRDAWMFLPGGVLVKWNTIAVGVGNFTYTFTTANSEPTFNSFVSVIAIPASIGVTTNVINVDNVTATTFDYSNDFVSDMTFIAWGIPTPITP